MSTNIGRLTGTTVTGYWWTVALRGVVAVLLGLVFLLRPGASLAALVLLFGAYALVGGLIAIVSAFKSAEHHQKWWPLLFDGLIGIAIGFLTFFRPGITAVALLYTIAIWAILTGVFQFIAAFTGFTSTSSKWLMGIAGVLSIILGILLFSHPLIGLVSLIWVLGIYALVFGVAQIILGFMLIGSPARS